MKVTFLGTKGYIKIKSKSHYRHSSTLIQSGETTILIDWGKDWERWDKWPINKKLERYKIDGLFLSNWHPDHSWGLKEKWLNVDVYASEKTWNFFEEKKFPVPSFGTHILYYEKEVNIKDLKIVPFEVIHTNKYDSLGFKISDNEITIFVCTDIIYIVNRDKALSGVNVYIGDGSTISTNMVRKDKNGKLFGHARIKTQASWLSKYGIKKMYITHVGSEIVDETYWETMRKLKDIGQKYDIEIILAKDGMEVDLKNEKY